MTEEKTVCKKCRIAKLNNEFYISKPREGIRQKKNGLDSWCKECHREKAREWNSNNKEKKLQYFREWYARHGNAYYQERKSLFAKRAFESKLKTQFGITSDDWEAMFQAQKGCCGICGKLSAKRRLCVDHCHRTNKVRGLLCNSCNRGLGYLGDDIERLQKSITYLQKHS